MKLGIIWQANILSWLLYVGGRHGLEPKGSLCKAPFWDPCRGCSFQLAARALCSMSSYHKTHKPLCRVCNEPDRGCWALWLLLVPQSFQYQPRCLHARRLQGEAVSAASANRCCNSMWSALVLHSRKRQSTQQSERCETP